MTKRENALVKYSEAKAPFERALAIREKVLGPEHPSVVQIKKNSASLFSEMDRSAEAGAVDASAGQTGE